MLTHTWLMAAVMGVGRHGTNLTAWQRVDYLGRLFSGQVLLGAECAKVTHIGNAIHTTTGIVPYYTIDVTWLIVIVCKYCSGVWFVRQITFQQVLDRMICVSIPQDLWAHFLRADKLVLDGLLLCLFILGKNAIESILDGGDTKRSVGLWGRNRFSIHFKSDWSRTSWNWRVLRRGD